MITADTMPVFPACPTFGFTSEPMYRVQVTQRDGGFERRTRKWSRPLHRYTGVPTGNRVEGVIQELLYFWHAMGGSTTAFRFKDWADYLSCPVGETPDSTNWAPLVATTESPTTYQLTKRYTYGSVSQDREIRRPVGSSIVIANELGVAQVSSRWTLDEATGILEPGGTFSGTPTYWSGEFTVPCRFDSELPVELSNHKIQRVTVSICEVRE